MLTRNLDKARVAYQNKDAAESKNAHLNHNLLGDHKEKHNVSGAYIKSGVYGGLDGIITTYSVVMGVAGADLASVVVVALGIANLIGDGICMALGDYLSTKSEIQFAKKERQREEWEVENNPEEEMNEMIEIYEQKGISREDAEVVVKIFSKNKITWVDIMMVEELGLLPNEENPMKNAVVTFISFVVFGLMPILPFLINEIIYFDDSGTLFYISTGLTGTFLFVLGFTKSFFTFSRWWTSGLETLIIGIIAAGSSFLIGLAFRPLTQDPSNGNGL